MMFYMCSSFLTFNRNLERVRLYHDYLITLQARAELPNGQQKVNIVATNIVLGHVDNSACQTNLAMMIGRVLCNVSSQLGNFNLFFELTLETAEEDLPLPGFKPIHDRGNGTNIVSHGKKDQLFVNEIAVAYGILSMVKKSPRNERAQPLLTIIDFLLAEGQLYATVVVLVHVAEGYAMLLNVGKVFLGFFRCARTKTCLY